MEEYTEVMAYETPKVRIKLVRRDDDWVVFSMDQAGTNPKALYCFSYPHARDIFDTCVAYSKDPSA